MWGSAWMEKNVTVYCDNQTVVAIINKGDSRESEAMHLIHYLVKFQFSPYTQHVCGRQMIYWILCHKTTCNTSCPITCRAHPKPSPLLLELLDLQ